MQYFITHTQDEALLGKQQASVLTDSILQANDRRSALVSRYHDAIAAYKQSKDVKTFKNTKKALDDKYRQTTEEVATLNKQLHDKDPEAHAKVRGGNMVYQFRNASKLITRHYPPYLGISSH